MNKDRPTGSITRSTIKVKTIKIKEKTIEKGTNPVQPFQGVHDHFNMNRKKGYILIKSNPERV
jgi:hypothetical protein